MLLILSPSTTLDFDTPAPLETHTQPVYLAEAEALVNALRGYTQEDLADVLGTSERLTQLNFERYQQWTRPFTPHNAKQAIFAFTGSVYEGLDAPTLPTAVLTEQAQARVCILSGLYGVLRPLDLMQPYRLEMKTSLPNPAGESLYPFWRERITAVLNDALAKLDSDIVLDLASGEYSKAVSKKALHGRVITCAFKELRKGKYRTISFYAKKARGQMARFILETEATTLTDVQQFNVDGYQFNPAESTAKRLTFTRGE